MYDLGLILNSHYLRFLPTNIMKSPLNRCSLSVCLLLCRRCSLATVNDREADRQTDRQTDRQCACLIGLQPGCNFASKTRNEHSYVLLISLSFM